ncbi:MAG: glutamate ligase domain-containing protein [Bifidobacterium sp.]
MPPLRLLRPRWGVDVENAAQAATSFLGAARRFQVRGMVGQVTVVDDYAHHPTEISALLDAARRRYPQSVIRVIFQPHLFSRTMFFASEFAEALAKADDVIVTGIFPHVKNGRTIRRLAPPPLWTRRLSLTTRLPRIGFAGGGYAYRGTDDDDACSSWRCHLHCWRRRHHRWTKVMLHSLQAHRWDCEG